VLRIEFETDVVKKDQLQKVLERAKHWRFPLVGTNSVLEQVGEVCESGWEGPAYLQDDSRSILVSRVPSDPCWQDQPNGPITWWR